MGSGWADDGGHFDMNEIEIKRCYPEDMFVLR